VGSFVPPVPSILLLRHTIPMAHSHSPRSPDPYHGKENDTRHTLKLFTLTKVKNSIPTFQHKLPHRLLKKPKRKPWPQADTIGQEVLASLEHHIGSTSDCMPKMSRTKSPPPNVCSTRVLRMQTLYRFKYNTIDSLASGNPKSSASRWYNSACGHIPHSILYGKSSTHMCKMELEGTIP
jgi:hypothetical protein